MSLPPLVSGARPLIGHAWEFLRDPGRVVRRGVAEHGGIFSVRLPGRPGVVLVGPEQARFFYAESDALRLSIRDAYRFLTHMFGGDTFWLASHQEYLRQREILVPQFAGRRVAAHVAEMDRKVSEFVDTLPSEGTFCLVDAFGPLVMDIATSLFLGEDVARRFGGLFDEFRTFSLGMDPLLPGWVPAPHLIRSRRARDRLRALTRALLAERRTGGGEDFLQALAQATYRDTGTPVPEDVLVNLVIILLWVGHETTTGHLSWALIDLLRHPEELARVRAEVTGVGELSMPVTHRLPHLDRALHETERLHPITAFVARQATVDIPHAGHVIPRGALVMLHPGMSHQLPEVFSEPASYRPDRFLTEPEQALQGFGGGLHRCLGEHFTYVEMKVVLTRLVQRLEMRLLDPDPVPETGHRSGWPRRPCRVAYAKKHESCS